MSQVQPGGERQGQRPSSPPKKASPPKRPAAKAAPKGRQNGAASKGRPTTRPPAGGKGRPPGGAKGRAPRQNTTITAKPPRRLSPSTMAFGAVALVVVIVVVFVVVKVAGGGSTPASTGQRVLPPPTAASTSVVADVTGVPASVISAVGTGQGVTAPIALKGQPALMSGGKPEVLFIGAEFCPLCAAERWALVQAMSRFGTWSGLEETASSPWDSDPSTSTFTFARAKFTSPYVVLTMVEHETNDNWGPDTRRAYQPLTTAQSNLWTNYSSKLGIGSPGFPFVDFGNKVFVPANSYDPGVLASLNQAEIAGKLTNASDPVTQGIVGTANYLTAAVCSMTGDQPASACSNSAVHKAGTSFQSQ